MRKWPPGRFDLSGPDGTVDLTDKKLAGLLAYSGRIGGGLDFRFIFSVRAMSVRLLK
jgi:hypothetical protein